MSISITNICCTQVIVERTTIEKTIYNVDMKMLDNYTIETQSPNGCKTIIGIPIARRLVGDQRTKNHITIVKRLKDK
jgi:hypothetical protein